LSLLAGKERCFGMTENPFGEVNMRLVVRNVIKEAVGFENLLHSAITSL